MTAAPLLAKPLALPETSLLFLQISCLASYWILLPYTFLSTFNLVQVGFLSLPNQGIQIELVYLVWCAGMQMARPKTWTRLCCCCGWDAVRPLHGQKIKKQLGHSHILSFGPDLSLPLFLMATSGVKWEMVKYWSALCGTLRRVLEVRDKQTGLRREVEGAGGGVGLYCRGLNEKGPIGSHI